MPAKKRKTVKPEYETDDSSSSSEAKEKHPEKSSWSPPHWEKVYENIRTMQAEYNAMRQKARKSNKSKYSAKDQRFHILISLMLSSQTKDTVTGAAMERLKEHGCTVQKLLDTSDKKLGQLIYPVGFWRTKVKYIKEVCKVLKEDYDSDIPRTVEELCNLKGVGPKMAYLCMCHAWNDCVGIGVDTHVHRIVARLGWTQNECKTPEHTRKGLEAWLPKDRWKEVNTLLVGFGKEICLPIGPKCGECLNRKLCPEGRKWTTPPPSPKKNKS
eukprot:TRINITY_DN6740_c0_g1_i6.p1 TRINITY_DN6740_c0_g1~~TRINITY_DN6740_c0_g1_i6.p1  ORF type:complete len:270 (-),score=75.16 TRINITY_DN6740_c0_g1_i6:155-964(-)